VRSPIFAVLVLGALAACEPPAELAHVSQAATTCADGATLPGIDVSTYQGTIDWDKVKAAGIQYAFIRVSHGLVTLDDKFDRNWSEAKRVGILRGAYQYLEPSDNTDQQAQLLIDTMGALDATDLPPVLDMEKQDAMTGAQLSAMMDAWSAKVSAATGRKPILYTSPAFWTGIVGSPASSTQHKLWIANYGVTCPDVPAPWTRWDFWQKSAKGSISGITGDVDLDVFNGDAAALSQFIGATSVCGDGACNSGETSASCAVDCGGCIIPGSGGVVDDHGACFQLAGRPASWRSETAGQGGSLRWTYAWAEPDQNIGTWGLELAEAGNYTVEVATTAPFNGSHQAKYHLRHGGSEEVVLLDQGTVDGWQTLGTFAFAAGADQRVWLGDSTGEPFSERHQLVFDDLRLTRVADLSPDGGAVDGGGDNGDGGGGEQPGDEHGCAMARGTSSPAWALLLGLFALGLRRRAR
jgi:lysozyme